MREFAPCWATYTSREPSGESANEVPGPLTRTSVGGGAMLNRVTWAGPGVGRLQKATPPIAAHTKTIRLATGVFDVIVTMPGYVTQRRKVKLKTGDIVILNVELYPKK